MNRYCESHSSLVMEVEYFSYQYIALTSQGLLKNFAYTSIHCINFHKRGPILPTIYQQLPMEEKKSFNVNTTAISLPNSFHFPFMLYYYVQLPSLQHGFDE